MTPLFGSGTEPPEAPTICCRAGPTIECKGPKLEVKSLALLLEEVLFPLLPPRLLLLRPLVAPLLLPAKVADPLLRDCCSSWLLP